VRKVFNIFAEASFFPEEFLLSLREDLERGKSTANYNKTVLADFDPAVITSINDHMREFRQSTLTNLEKQYAEKEKALDVGNQVISKIKGSDTCMID
jgi:N12 class adenine-specific DNA methylase